MKVYLSLLAALTFGALSISSASAQQLKVGTVDMNKILEAYYGREQAQKTLSAAEAEARKDLEERMEELKKEMAEGQKLNEEIARPELSKDAKEAKTALRDKKANEFAVKQREFQQYADTKQQQLQQQKLRMQGDLIKEVQTVVTEQARIAQYDLVLDKGSTGLTPPAVLFANNNFDFTDTVITALNKNKPAGSSTTSAAPAEKPKAEEGAKPATGTKKNR